MHANKVSANLKNRINLMMLKKFVFLCIVGSVCYNHMWGVLVSKSIYTMTLIMSFCWSLLEVK